MGSPQIVEASPDSARSIQTLLSEGKSGHPALVLPVGDAQLEPFWPQGLGTNRGFHTALNAVWSMLCYRFVSLERAVLEQHFAFTAVVQSFATFRVNDHKEWSADPATRISAAFVIA